MTRTVAAVLSVAAVAGPSTDHRSEVPPPPGARPPLQQPRNVAFILSDDHRHDLMDFHPDAPESALFNTGFRCARDLDAEVGA
jgi:hypothetical protein